MSVSGSCEEFKVEAFGTRKRDTSAGFVYIQEMCDLMQQQRVTFISLRSSATWEGQDLQGQDGKRPGLGLAWLGLT